MKYYGYLDESLQVIDERKGRVSKPESITYLNEQGELITKKAIKMKGERPTPDHIASSSGDWVLPSKGEPDNGTEQNAS